MVDDVFFTKEKTMKIIWFDERLNSSVYDDKIPQELTRSTRKFLYWPNIIVASGDSFIIHRMLHDVASRKFSTAKRLVPKTTPEGAGDSKDGMITFWGSSGFEMVTPPELRDQIIAALGLTQSPQGYTEDGDINR